MKIYDGESKMPIDVNLWWWKLIMTHRWKIYDSEMIEVPMDV